MEGVKSLSAEDGHQKAHTAVFEILDAGRDNVLTKGLDPAAIKKLSRNWKLLEEDARLVLRDVLPRLDLDVEAMGSIASKERASCGITVTGQEIAANPYVIAEMYCGTDASDRISWSTVDRGVLPSPDLGGKPLADIDYNDERRFRALCVEHLRRESKHTFRFARELVIEIAKRMDRLPPTP
jgi:exodeoxyribonuclease V alpha subunit